MPNKIFIFLTLLMSCVPLPSHAGYDGFLFQPANVILAGPSSGGSGTAKFRALVAADIPALSYLSTTLASGDIFVGSAGNVATAQALSGDATLSNVGVLTFDTVNGNVGSFGSSTSIPSFTVNAKGLITAASGNAVIAPAGTLSGTTLNSSVVSSSLTSVGTIASGTWNGTTIAIANGGTGQTTANAAFAALSPMTTAGDIIYEDATPTPVRLGIGSAGQVLTVAGGVPTWATPGAGSGQTLVGSIHWATAAGCTWSVATVNATTFSSPAANVSCNGPTATGSITSPVLNVPQAWYASAPIGNYTVVATGNFWNDGSELCIFRIDEVTNSVHGTLNSNYFASNQGVTNTVNSGIIHIGTAGTTLKFGFSIAGFNGGSSCGVEANSSAASQYGELEMDVYYSP